MLEIKDLHVEIGGKEILHDINLKIGDGETHVLLGPNGSGKSTLLITKKFGPRIRFLSVLTDAPLSPGKKLSIDYCKNCEKCINACPVKAIGDDRKVDVTKCSKENMRWGLPGVIKFARKLISTSIEDERHALIKNPEFWEIWQNLSTGIFYYCFECLNSCPIGKKK
jgi:epoxyqueuosine reductase QueG